MPAPAVFAHQALRQMLDFALPPRCPGCGAVTGEPHRFCLDCWRSLAFLGEPCCARCGLPFEYGGEEEAECGRCLAEPPPFDRLRAAVAYGDVSRRVALKLKYSGRPGLAGTLAHFMLRHLREGEGDALIVPVPLHRWRIWRRGYNQAALIASRIHKLTDIRVISPITRIRDTQPQANLSKNARLTNVDGAFQLRSKGAKLIAAKRILVIDDVMTTGATLQAVGRALLQAEPASLCAIVLAVADPLHRQFEAI
jgi:ComF family protein